MSGDRQIESQSRFGERGRRWLFSPLNRLEALNGVAEQSNIEIETDGSHVTALLRAEQVTGAADFEVVDRYLKPGAELGRLEDGLEAALGCLGEGVVPLVQEIGIGTHGAPPNPASELVELGKTK